MQSMERWEIIYGQINGLFVDELEGIPDETAPEGVLAPLLKRAYDARERICDRFGIDAGRDKDFEDLVRGFEGFARACGRLMYQYGYQDGIKGK